MGAEFKIVHIINELNTGGAEMMLYKLMSGINRASFTPTVISLMDIGPVGDKIKKLGVEIMCLDMKPGTPDPIKMLRLAGILRKMKPDIIQTWLWHSDLIGTIAARISGQSVPIVWNIRITDLDHDQVKRSSIMVSQACARLSRSAWAPAGIVCCSNVAVQDHIRMGYDSGKMRVINNGFDISAYIPDKESGMELRRELSIPENNIIIGMAARFHPQKDHHNFIQAAKIISDRHPDVNFLLCGDDVDWNNKQLASWIGETGLRSSFRLLGRRNDMPRVLAALDIATLSSCSGEAFPNVIGEAMSCGVPCVATDVGDSSLIIADTGIVVPPRDPDALADGWNRLIESGTTGRHELGVSARERAVKHYSLELAIESYEKLYTEIILNNRTTIKRQPTSVSC